MTPFDVLVKEATEIPMDSRMAFMAELRRPTDFPQEPELTRDVVHGKVKIAYILKEAQPEEAQAEMVRAAETDPEVQAALDFMQAKAERDEAVSMLEEAQAQAAQAMQAAQDSEARAQMAEQSAMQAQEQATMAAQQAQQEAAGRQAATVQAIQAADNTIQTQVAHQQHRAQLAQAADQLKMQADTLTAQLKELAASDPTVAMAAQAQQQQQMMGAGGDPAAMGGGQAGAAAPVSDAEAVASGVPQGVAKQQQEALKAQQEADIQRAQAEAAARDEAAKQQMAAEQAAGQQMKMSADRRAEIAARLHKVAKSVVGESLRLGYQHGRNERKIYRLAKQLRALGHDAKIEKGDISDLPKLFRAASHLGKHQEKYLAGAGLATAAAATPATVKAVKKHRAKKQGKEKTARRSGRPLPEGFAYRKGGVVRTDPWYDEETPLDPAEAEAQALRMHRANRPLAAGFGAGAGAMGGFGLGHDLGGLPGGIAGLGIGAALGGGGMYALSRALEGRAGSQAQKRARKAVERLEEALGKEKGAALRPEHVQVAKEFGKSVGKRLAAPAIGAGAGATLGAIEATRHGKRFGRDQPTNRELELMGDLQAAMQRAQRNPTYKNKIRVTKLRTELELEQGGRTHPGRHILRRAGEGAVAGAIGGAAIRGVAGAGREALEATGVRAGDLLRRTR